MVSKLNEKRLGKTSLAFMGATGFEPVTPSVSSWGSSNVSVDTKGLVTTDPNACTAPCTSIDDKANTDTLDALAAALLGLSQTDRERLAAMLLGKEQSS